ncbi:hypothetical protein C3L23_05710 [Nautilia sp. PV-1]|uniref:GGDEF domain-containing protein n=1 Tax=Nautilia sp. PV-1 TaxID=2579250 RepID=UPI000FDC5837|nr:GGDEF domain-containing protein [Nautilia sp. PV-1]AZV46787.1 hypothetical protein C3L23_05710 [Nautilia sp. PV-1]
MKIKNIECHHNSDINIMEFKDIKNSTINDVSKIFTKNKTDVLVITKEKKPYYILTSSDIIDALVAHFDNIPLSDYIERCPKSLITVSEEETVFEAYRLMRSYKIHHLIVIDEDVYFKKIINFYDFASYLTEMALKDEMTGLYNKRFFEFIIDRYKSEDMEIGIIFLDLDNFKRINDTYGHLFGDEVIKKVANVIKQSIRDIDYAFRFGGDEFVIMIFADSNVLSKVAKRIVNKIHNASIKNNIKLECSLGFAHRPTDSEDLEKVLKIADKRMYENKKAVKS